MSAIVIITPASAEVKDNFAINAVTGTPSPAERQVQARILTATSAEMATADATGGQDPQTSPFVQQSDIDAAASTAKQLATQAAQAALQQQVMANEAPVNSPQCTLQVTSNHAAGDRAATVTVTAQATCTQEVYDQQTAQSMVADLLKLEASRNPGPTYAQVGNLMTSVTQATVVDTRGTISLLIAADGIWAYQLSSSQMQAFAQLIAGRSQSEAISILSQQPGVGQVQIDILGGGNILPQDPAQIAITIQSVSGLS